MNVLLLTTTLALRAISTALAAETFECPTVYTLTSAHCASFCNDATIASDSCIFYPTTGASPCADTSVGYCAATSSPSCAVKCLTTSFWTDDKVSLGDGKPGKTLSLGLRGTVGSIGRSEPVDAIQNLALQRVTKLTVKDFLLDEGEPAMHHIALLAPTADKEPTVSELQTLELVNVNLEFASSADLLPSTLTTLVLNNNALSLTASPSLRQDDNSTSHFPMQIFSLASLKSLDLSGNAALQKSSFTSEQLAFFQKLATFNADFTL